jgi:hypothetical protein
MCDCYGEEFEDLSLAAEESEPLPQVVPLLVVKKRK